jgi:aspartate/methionine/tyrosine aminotransferase
MSIARSAVALRALFTMSDASHGASSDLARAAASLRASRVPAFRVMEVMKAAHDRERAGGRVFHMEVGQPSVGPPRSVLEKAKASLDACARGETTLGYTVADGTDELRARVATHYERRYGVVVDPESVMITTGSSAAFVLAFIAAFDAGDRVAIAAPGYPCYRNILEALGVCVVPVPVDASTNFQPTPGLLEEADARDPTKPIKGVIVASPSNPTGTVLSRDELFALHDWCAGSGKTSPGKAWFVSDEIYHQIEYGDERAATALEAPNALEEDVALVINSFSKYHCLTGWRVGWCIVPAGLETADDGVAAEPVHQRAAHLADRRRGVVRRRRRARFWTRTSSDTNKTEPFCWRVCPRGVRKAQLGGRGVLHLRGRVALNKGLRVVV